MVVITLKDLDILQVWVWAVIYTNLQDSWKLVESGQNRGLHQSHRTKLYWEHLGGHLLILYRSGFICTCISGMYLKVTQDRITGSDMTLYHLIPLEHAGMNQCVNSVYTHVYICIYTAIFINQTSPLWSERLQKWLCNCHWLILVNKGIGLSSTHEIRSTCARANTLTFRDSS